MGEHHDLFKEEVWRPALERYGAVTRLTVALYDRQQRLVKGPYSPSPLFAFFREHGYEPAVLTECVRQCLDAPVAGASAIVSHAYGVAVVGTPLMLSGRTVGAAVGGYALVDFCQSSAIESLAHHARVAFRQLWAVALHTQPIPERRLTMCGELLNVLCDAVLRESERTRQFQALSEHLDLRVAERTQELEGANQALARELRDRNAAEARIRALLSRLVLIQEDERRRIARDVHDHLGQLMTGLKLRLEVLAAGLVVGSPEFKDALATAQALLQRLDTGLTSFTSDLRPLLLDDFGLPHALASFVHDWSRNFGIEAEFHDLGVHPVRLAADVEVNLFRIAQEALNNIYKHANATTVDVRLQRRAEHIVLIIEDDGQGFDPSVPLRNDARLEMGLIGMRERVALVNGTLDIESAPGQGTAIIVAVPVRLTSSL